MIRSVPFKLAVIVVSCVVLWFTPPVQKRLAMIQANAALEAIEQGQLAAAAALAAQAEASALAHGWSDVGARAALATATIAQKQGHMDEAASAYRRALEGGGLDATSADVQFALGELELHQKHPREAVAACEAGMKLLARQHTGPSAEQLKIYADALEAAGRKDDARKIRERVSASSDDEI